MYTSRNRDLDFSKWASTEGLFVLATASTLLLLRVPIFIVTPRKYRVLRITPHREPSNLENEVIARPTTPSKFTHLTTNLRFCPLAQRSCIQNYDWPHCQNGSLSPLNKTHTFIVRLSGVFCEVISYIACNASRKPL